MLQRIADKNKSASVLVLGRYGFLEKRLQDQKREFPGLDISFSTVHAAKGLEKDYVVIMDVVTGRYGFPSEIDDDPIMNLVLSFEQGIPNAEERRVFYVAMTRARHKTFILTEDHRRSQFIDELEGEEFHGCVIPSKAGERVASCPVCHGSTLRFQVSRFGEFYSCSSFRCRGKALKCPACESEGLVRQGALFRCLFCGKTQHPCPNCGEGYVRHFPAGIAAGNGRAYSAFRACSRNRNEPKFRCWTESSAVDHHRARQRL